MSATAFLSATALARRIRSGRLSAADALELYVERRERFHARLNAIVVTDIERARKAARAADRAIDRGEKPGPLTGVPITVKESYDVAGLPTTWGVTRHSANIARRNAPAVQRLIDAGAIVWGKSNVPVLLADWQTHNPIYGTTNNPWDTARTPGGSSGGGAAALAAGLTALEYGSDIGGSIRGPAHYCGIYGHKTTFGIVPTAGHALPDVYAATDMSVLGPLARSASDLELALKLTAGPAGDEARALRLTLPRPAFDDFKGLRVAVAASDPVAEVDASVSGAIESLAGFLSKRKARVTLAAKLPVDMVAHDRLYVLLRRAATSMRAHDDAAFARLLAQRDTLDVADRSYRAEQVRGNTLFHRDWLRLNNERHRLRLAWQEFFRHHDVLLCPSAASTAFVQNPHGERWERTIPVNGKRQPDTTQIFWMGFASVAYLPATVAPIALAMDGLPTGVQIVGAQYADLSTIRFAALLEREYYAFHAPRGYE
jgi:amidase